MDIKDCSLIKINFNDFYEFYFFNENPIFVRINIEKTNIKDNSKEVFKAELNETESTSLKEIKNPFLINLRMKLNRIIFDFINILFSKTIFTE